ncbi:uncharacterized protein [Pyxicephalus adspersus]|uniref:uncharacterized protein n=1 Tax=Pyxicephalus adspersus TaxID=30357 RepID=UPI003B590D74
MDISLLLFIIMIPYGLTTEHFDERLVIFANFTDELILPLPAHLLHEIKNVFWKKETEQIAVVFGTLPSINPLYSEIIEISYSGSLIIKPLNWEDGEEYSAEIILNNSSMKTISYQVKANYQRYTLHKNDPRILSATVGEDLILPLENEIIEHTAIEEIDWLTERWVFFATTKVDGQIRFPENIYYGGLSSTSNGSLIFKKVTKDDEGVYRACIYSCKGEVEEQLYHVRIIVPALENHFEKSTTSASTPFTGTVKIVLFLICMLICSIVYTIYLSLRRKKKETIYSQSLEETQTFRNPKECEKSLEKINPA